MGLFNKKPEEPKKEEKPISYKDWESDFGFLSLILQRKKGIAKEFLIKTYAAQKAEKDLLLDDEVSPIIENVITETVNILSDKYKDFLVDSSLKGIVKN